MYRRYIKVFLDFCLSILLLIVLSPLYILLMIVCFVAFQGKIFFKQQRVGKNDRIFTIYKFTTMKPVSIILAEDKDRLTNIGKILRKSSLDELPQLFNVIMGNMSIIGPRPLLIKYLPFYTAQERIRHTVKPGITGLAQVRGRNLLSWNERLKLDTEYVKTLSFKNDCIIFIKTIESFITAKNVQTDPRTFMRDLDAERTEGFQEPENKI